MNFKYLQILLLLLISNSFQEYGITQDYKRYYQLIDSATYFKSIDDNLKADDFYTSALIAYRGFSNDHLTAILNNYYISNKLNFEMIKNAFQDGLNYRDLKFQLSKQNIFIPERNLKKLYRKNRIKKKRSLHPIYFALIADQIPRSRKNGDISEVDRRTGIKIKKWMIEKPYLFNRFETGFIGSELIYILMIHAGWENLESVQDTIYNLTQKGLIHRNTLADIIERSALYRGSIFSIDSINPKLINNIDTESSLCGQHYSNISLNYGKIYDADRKVVLTPPIHPSLNEVEINTLRNYLFLTTIEFYYISNPKYLKVSPEEYCSFKSK